MRYYIKATGSTCYDRTGITFPEKKELDLEGIVKNHGGYNLRWESQFGWTNQPDVLTFKALQNDLNPVKELELVLPNELIICHQYWS